MVGSVSRDLTLTNDIATVADVEGTAPQSAERAKVLHSTLFPQESMILICSWSDFAVANYLPGAVDGTCASVITSECPEYDQLIAISGFRARQTGFDRCYIGLGGHLVAAVDRHGDESERNG